MLRITILNIIIILLWNNSASKANNKSNDFYVIDDSVNVIEEVSSKREYLYTNGEIINTYSSNKETNVILKYNNELVGFTIYKTYYIPGAGFCKKDYKDATTFNYELITSCKELLKDDFITIESSKMKIPLLPLRASLSGRWSILNGHSQLDYKEHKNIERSIKEIENTYDTKKCNKLNLIGSSYGSVVAANTAIALLERNNTIDSLGVLVLSSSMIHPESDIGLKLKKLNQENKIETIYYHSTPNDNITSCSGKSREEAKRGFKNVVFKSSPSIMNLKKHAHNIASRTPKRAHDLLDFLFKNSDIKWSRKLNN